VVHAIELTIELTECISNKRLRNGGIFRLALIDVKPLRSEV